MQSSILIKFLSCSRFSDTPLMIIFCNDLNHAKWEIWSFSCQVENKQLIFKINRAFEYSWDFRSLIYHWSNFNYVLKQTFLLSPKHHAELFQIKIALKKLTFNNYWIRLSVISRTIKAEVGVICRSRIILFTWNYLSLILCTNYSLELFSFIICAKTKKRLLLVLQTIICNRGRGRSIIGGPIFIYLCCESLISFEIDCFTLGEHEYMNMGPPIIDLPRYPCKRDVIITEYQELFFDVTS